MGWWKETVDIAKKNGPVARSSLETTLAYPGIKVLVVHCLPHFLWKHGLKLIARMRSQFQCLWTQTEIHPGAGVTEGVFTDHGSGSVTGETATVGKGTILYHGVTLGGAGKDVGKRHPIAREGALVSARAQVIDPIEIGKNIKVGATAVVVVDVPAGVTVAGAPTKVARVHDKKDVDAIHNMEENREYYTSKFEKTRYQNLHSSELQTT